MDGDATDDTIVAMFTVLKSVYPSSLIDDVGRVAQLTCLARRELVHEAVDEVPSLRHPDAVHKQLDLRSSDGGSLLEFMCVLDDRID